MILGKVYAQKNFFIYGSIYLNFSAYVVFAYSDRKIIM